MMDFIYIEDEKGKQITFEVVTIFNIEDSEHNYIIYRSLDKEKYYIAKYLGENVVDLDTNLSDKELRIGNTILEQIIK